MVGLFLQTGALSHGQRNPVRNMAARAPADLCYAQIVRGLVNSIAGHTQENVNNVMALGWFEYENEFNLGHIITLCYFN